MRQDAKETARMKRLLVGTKLATVIIVSDFDAKKSVGYIGHKCSFLFSVNYLAEFPEHTPGS